MKDVHPSVCCALALAAGLCLALGAWLVPAAWGQETAEKPKPADDRQQALDRILAECDKANQALKDLSADIGYIRVIKALDQRDVRSGELKFKKPRKVSIKFTQPEEKLHVVNEDTIWIYTPAEKQAERYRVSKDRRRETGFIDFGFGSSVEDVKKNYNISLSATQQREGKAFHLLELTPKSDEVDTPYCKTLLLIEADRWIPTEITLFESEGEIVTTIELKKIRINPGVPDKTFKFELPKGVQLVEP